VVVYRLPIEAKHRILTKKKCREPRPFAPCKELVVIDKPPGPFSYWVTDKVKKALHAKRAGHAGTLDPKVTGVLPIGFNNGTKVLTALRTDKEYECVMHIHSDVPKTKILKTRKLFIGPIKQLPPVRSAVKRRLRTRHVYYLKINKIEGRDVFFTIGCEAGTYVRKICSDWGEALGTQAHMKYLRRTKAGPFSLEDAVTLDAFLKNPKKHLLPIERAVEHLKKIWIDDNTVLRVKHGSKVYLPGVCKYNDGINKDELIAVMSIDSQLIALGKAEMTSLEIKKSTKGLVASLERVM